MHTISLRLKRMRRSPQARAIIREHRLHPKQFVAPLFIHEGLTKKQEITSMPGQYQLSLNCLAEEIDSLSELGIPAVLLFGIPQTKDATGTSSINDKGIIQQAIRKIRETNSELLIIADACFCEYTAHGHCGVLTNQQIDNDATLAQLAKQAVSLANAGADWIAPSGMTDGMVGTIRQALDKANHHDIAILSYAVKYCSSLYGPFRDAAQGAPQFGDRKTYQMDPANSNEALREAALDLQEGADMLMVKPAGTYLDVICRIKQQHPEVPLCAYQVSGEYSMIKAAAEKGYIHEQQTMYESLIAIKRAGADFIISYFAKDIATLLKQNPDL